MIKRVERFTSYSRDGMKPNRIVRYYLFGFILIYESETLHVTDVNNLSNKIPSNLTGQRDTSGISVIPPKDRNTLYEGYPVVRFHPEVLSFLGSLKGMLKVHQG